MSEKMLDNYQGHWLDIQLVPKYFRIPDSQATLQGIKIAYNGHTKLRFPQLHTHVESYQLL